MNATSVRIWFLLSVLFVSGAASTGWGAELNVQVPAGYTSRIDGPKDEVVYDSAADGAGNLYVVGRFNSVEASVDVFRDASDSTTGRPGLSSHTTFLNTKNPTDSNPSPDLFVIKYDRDGNVVWKRTVGSGGQTLGTGIVVDPSGNVYISGSFGGTATFGAITITCAARSNVDMSTTTSNVLVDANVFIAMLDKDGVWQWARQLDFSLFSTPVSSEVNPGTDVFAGSSIVIRTDYTGGGADRAFGTNQGHSLIMDADGNLYLKGTIDHVAMLTPQNTITWLRTDATHKIAVSARVSVSGTQREVRYRDNAFIVKLAASGPQAGSAAGVSKTYAWSWVASPSSNIRRDPASGGITAFDTGTADNGIFYGNTTSSITGFAVDNNNSVYLTGDWKGNLIAGGVSRDSAAAREGYVARWRASDGVPISGVTYTGDSAGVVRGGAVVLDENRNAYVTGACTNSASLTLRHSDTGSLTYNLSAVGSNYTRFFIAKLNGGGAWQWVDAPTSGNTVTTTAPILTRDASGALYLGGRLSAPLGSTTLDFRTNGTTTATVRATNGGGSAAFVVKLVETGATTRNWKWAVQTQDSNGGTASPAFDTSDLELGLGGTVYWFLDSMGAQPFSNSRSPISADTAFDTTTARGAFLLPIVTDDATLSTTFSVFNTVTSGKEIAPPDGVFRDSNGRPLQPDIVLPGANNADGKTLFYWDNFEKKLFAVAPVVADIRWKVTSDPTSTAAPLSRRVATVWPTPAQGLITQVTGGGPNGDEPRVNLEPPSTNYTFGSILYQENSSQVIGAKLLATKGSGYAVLLYTNGKNSAAGSAPVSLEVVRSYLWTDTAVVSTANAEIGQPISGAAFSHSDPTGKNGYVVNSKARIDGYGPGAAYDFTTQLGPIIPVNTDEQQTSDDDLYVVWSSTNTKGVAWPSKSVHYTCTWPANPEQIVVTSMLGSEMETDAKATFALNYGASEQFPASDGTIFQGVNSAPAGTTLFNDTVPIAATTDQTLYRSGIRGTSFSLDYNTGNGQFMVTLYFADVVPDTVTNPPKKGMNVKLEGVDVLTDFSIAQRAGGTNAAIALKFPVTVTDGVLSASFTKANGFDLAQLNAIKITPAQEKLDPAKFQSLAIYHQPDKNLTGYNPNEEHAFLAPSQLSPYSAVFALRNDLNDVGNRTTSQPYVLLRYQDATDGLKTKFKVYQVLVTNNRYSFSSFRGMAGTRVQAPYPLPMLGDAAGTTGEGIPFFKDRKNQVWAKSAGTLTGRYFYPLQPNFWYDLNGDGLADENVTNVPWLDRYNKDVLGASSYGQPVPVPYTITWPATAPTLAVGDTLTSARNGLPDVESQASTAIIYDEANPGLANASNSSVRLIDYTEERKVSLNGIIDGQNFVLGSLGLSVELTSGGRYRFRDLPFHLKSRLTFDPVNKQLIFSGYKNADGAGVPLVLLNVMSSKERDRLLAFDGTPTSAAWDNAINGLFNLSRNPNAVDLNNDNAPDQGYFVGLKKVGNTLKYADALGPKALTAGKATGLGYVTLVENNADGLGAAPISLHILKVVNPPVVGELKIIFSDNALDEKITVRHSNDFAGDPDGLYFEWYYVPATTPTSPPLPGQPNAPSWIPLASGLGVNDVTIEGAGLATLADSWVICRYRGFTAGGYSASTFTEYAGDPASTPTDRRAAFVPGWIKRVIEGINPFEARVHDFGASATQTYSSLIAQAGTRYEGAVALNSDPNNLNNLGLISLYQTILQRGLGLSIDGTPSQTNDAVNTALLLASTRLSDFYTLLGNEAYADAQDPTVGFTSAAGEIGSLAPSVFAFANQLPSLMDEELTLLRGRDNSSAGVGAAPVYNRLFWNFTGGLEGEPVYVQNYGITDQNGDGIINETDARKLFPQGHGDAWGHYLSAVKSSYRLLRHPLYTWNPRSETTLVAGVALEVDYLDERKFANAAAARAAAGAEIVNLTYRQKYVADPAGQWQGYKDPETARAWGVDEWARRAGQGAYLDWLTSNAILPAVHKHPLRDPSAPPPSGLQKIDRTTVTELAKISAAYTKVQTQMDQADQGLNPLGITPGAIPFDIDPAALSSGEGSHFEQIYDRTMGAIANARRVFDFASESTNRLRQVQLSADQFAQDSKEQEFDYKNRLIEIFGYPYAGDIGSGKTYPTGYTGPDLYHYNYVAVNNVSGNIIGPDSQFTAFFSPFGQEYRAPDGGATSATDLQGVVGHYFTNDVVNPEANANAVLQVSFPVSTASAWSFTAPSTWGQRRAPGTLQLAIADMVRAEAELRRGLLNYNNHLAGIQDQIDLLLAKSGVQADNIKVLNKQRNTIVGLNATIGTARAVSIATSFAADLLEKVSDSTAGALPTAVGLSNDVTAPIRGAIRLAGAIGYGALTATGNVSEIAAQALELSKEQVALNTEIEIQKNDFSYEIQEQLKVIEAMLREEVGLRLDLFNLQQALDTSFANYQSTLAEGQRILEERIMYRQKVAGAVQLNRYQDLTFRNFRNDALQKYRASFDLAARYSYLAATTYDFETVQLGTSTAAGRRFLTDIVRERALGQFDGDGVPVNGVNGLSDPLARLKQNFDSLKGRLGINNPQIETGRFSLRHELYRLRDESDDVWSDQLQAQRVADLWQVPEFRRFCRPFAPESAGAQPGLVLTFSTDVTFGLNFFGLPLGGGDSAYDSSNYATKISSVGVWFENYDGQGLSTTPRVYLIPAGLDVLRAPDDATLATREFDVVDQAIPTPFPVGTSSLQNPSWIPTNDSLDTVFNQTRQFSRFRAYHDAGFDPSELVGDTRLVGRSVWNTKWMLIIPGGTLLNDPTEGLDTFILGRKIPGALTGARDGNGIKDIKLFFQSYSYSGN